MKNEKHVLEINKYIDIMRNHGMQLKKKQSDEKSQFKVLNNFTLDLKQNFKFHANRSKIVDLHEVELYGPTLCYFI